MSISSPRLARWYLDCARQLEAGLPLPEALQGAGGVSLKQRQALSAALKHGHSWDETLQNAQGWLPQTDRYLLSAAGESARLPEAFRSLADLHQDAARNRQKVILACLYPGFVLNLAALVIPALSIIKAMVEDSAPFDFGAYSQSAGICLLSLWGGIVLIGMLFRYKSSFVSSVGRLIPFLRGYFRNRSLSLFAFTLDAFYRAGAPLPEAFFAAGLCSGSNRLKRAGLMISQSIDSGQKPSDALEQQDALPTEFTQHYRTGEHTGQLDRVLPELSNEYRQRSARSLALASFVYSKLIFLLVAFLVGIEVVQWYAGYLDSVIEILDG